ncbi:MAG: glycosyltransferase family 2 protein [Bryobacteraceae bacterium]|nr:glycosyltransferase family 2 protein [Bryobacteraceae bacterium]
MTAVRPPFEPDEDVSDSALVRYLRQKNAGPAAARNLGLHAARHEYVAFTDDDCLAHGTGYMNGLRRPDWRPEQRWADRLRMLLAIMFSRKPVSRWWTTYTATTKRGARAGFSQVTTWHSLVSS